MFTADEAERAGLVSKIVAKEVTVEEAIKMGEKIASFSKPIIALAKEAVNGAYDNHLQQGITFERRLFHSTFSTHDQKEGMAAFVGKRAPAFKDE
jgi:enoyl-CoA hydratase